MDWDSKSAGSLSDLTCVRQQEQSELFGVPGGNQHVALWVCVCVQHMWKKLFLVAEYHPAPEKVISALLMEELTVHKPLRSR